jgi:ferrous iron transport protein A
LGQETTFSLDSVKKGITVRIVEIPQGRSRAQLIRLGIVEGHLIRCLERLPGGTVIVQNHRQEVAMGAVLARSILVTEHHASKRSP